MTPGAWKTPSRVREQSVEEFSGGVGLGGGILTPRKASDCRCWCRCRCRSLLDTISTIEINRSRQLSIEMDQNVLSTWQKSVGKCGKMGKTEEQQPLEQCWRFPTSHPLPLPLIVALHSSHEMFKWFFQHFSSFSLRGKWNSEWRCWKSADLEPQLRWIQSRTLG